jgi:hypothetical protein
VKIPAALAEARELLEAEAGFVASRLGLGSGCDVEPHLQKVCGGELP